ncbi:Uncharacterised protein [Enterobacter cloacae]|nr:Uncharacterised protein [Enterobacter cloacae]
MQDFNPAGGKFVGEDRAAVVHPGGNLRGFRARRRRDIHNPLRLVPVGKQRSNRQHGAGFLNIKQPAQVLGGAAERQALLVIPFDPETLFTPRHWR